MHLSEDAPKDHMQRDHNTYVTRRTLTQNTTSIASAHDTSYDIHEQAPILNKQVHQFRGGSKGGAIWAIAPPLGDFFHFLFLFKKSDKGPVKKVDEIRGIFRNPGLNFGRGRGPSMGERPRYGIAPTLAISWIRPCTNDQTLNFSLWSQRTQRGIG